MTIAAEKRRLLAGCDEQQIAAITSDAAPLLIVAGAGSGKTRVLTRRIAWCIGEGAVTPRHVLALTFTRKAAGELRSRLNHLGLESPVMAGTFHSVALAQLRRRAADRGKSAPVVLDSKARILAELLRDRTVISETTKRRLTKTEALSHAAGEIEWAKARLVAPSHYPSAIAAVRRTSALDPDLVVELFEGYEREKKRRGVLDFDDLLVRLLEAIQNDPEFAATQRWTFQYLFVDEFQDANSAQIQLLDAWVGGRPQLCAVGDPRQAIYGWNGADASGVATFTERYPGATVLALDANHRSTPQVVAIATTCLTAGEVTPNATRPDGAVPTLTAYPDDDAEVAGVIAGLRQAHGPGRRWSSCAVLARTNSQLRMFEEALEAARIPARTSGGRKFLERRTVATALSELRRASAPAAFHSWLASREEEAEELEGADQEDLLALVAIGREYADLDLAPNGAGLLVYLRDALRNDLPPGQTDAVDLVTFHRAKGLEWPTVFVTGLEDGFVPIAHARNRTAIDEEQRLLYVALSRAEEELHCSWAKARLLGSRKMTRGPSPYLGGIESARRALELQATPGPEIAKRALAESRAALGVRAKAAPTP